ncbi:hypothetical protein NP233_g10548 [Leucocoprinus birnbaumii]|uniref:Ion transport domain-containing protein n=1 Tax=Leucocoprinus birnbaumii TaxID=56174 RepID=A0AAD5VI32_9AGAR|nr:hypothetical protein NP233_g10548 [Leucocoprinus birnbaumii]
MLATCLGLVLSAVCPSSFRPTSYLDFILMEPHENEHELANFDNQEPAHLTRQADLEARTVPHQGSPRFTPDSATVLHASPVKSLGTGDAHDENASVRYWDKVNISSVSSKTQGNPHSTVLVMTEGLSQDENEEEKEAQGEEVSVDIMSRFRTNANPMASDKSSLPRPSLKDDNGSPPAVRPRVAPLRSTQASIRRASLRVVNLAGSALEDPMAVTDENDERETRDGVWNEQLPSVLPLRGHTLGIFGPDSALRLFLYRVFTHSQTERVVLMLVLLNAVVLTVQASSPASRFASISPRVEGYFRSWEESALLALFSIFTLEAFARICVTGFLFDSELSIYACLSQPPSPPHRSLPGKFIQRLQGTWRSLFSLESNKYPRSTQHLALTPRNIDVKYSLPFRLAVQSTVEKTKRGLPYLRQGWNRIDFIAVLSFWITFGLAVTGAERGKHHVGLFRALSALRTARLLTMTTGTTEGKSPEAGTIMSFDAIWYSAFQVMVTLTGDGWKKVMYAVIDSDVFAACLFFIVCVIALDFWLRKLFLAAMIHTFRALRSSTRTTVFGGTPLVLDQDDLNQTSVDAKVQRPAPLRKRNHIRVIYHQTRLIWPLLALVSFILQASRPLEVSKAHGAVPSFFELGITLAFDVEIAVRLLGAFPNWREFWLRKRNAIDLVLALARFYRVILVVPTMKPLLLLAFGNVSAIANLFLFFVLLNYITTLVAVQLFREVSAPKQMSSYSDFGYGFLSVWRIFSGKKWTSVFYSATTARIQVGGTVIVAIFLVLAILFSALIVQPLFVAVIDENFHVAEATRRSKAAFRFWAGDAVRAEGSTWTKIVNPYRWFNVSAESSSESHTRRISKQRSLSLSKDGIEREELDHEEVLGDRRISKRPRHGSPSYLPRWLGALEKLFTGRSSADLTPLARLKQHTEQQSQDPGIGSHVRDEDETERQLDLLMRMKPERTTLDTENKFDDRKQRDTILIQAHPSFDKVFWLIPQGNWARRMCQRIVQPPHDGRINGVQYSPVALCVFQLIILLVVIGGIVVGSIATPLYDQNHSSPNRLNRISQLDIAERALSFTLCVEFMLKVLADGLIWAPDAYLTSGRNILDFFIMIGTVINVAMRPVAAPGAYRRLGVLKALKVLRLITLFHPMRSTFRSLMAWRVLAVLGLTVLYMMPYATWGLNDLFREDARMRAVVADSFGFLVPRVWDNSLTSKVSSFDSFKLSLLALYEISLSETWADMVSVATKAAGKGVESRADTTPVNSIFFLIYNITSTVTLALLTSIMINHFSSRAGTAFLTQPQREWINLEKFLRRQEPLKRPTRIPINRIKRWCYNQSVHKNGWWPRVMTILLCLHVLALMSQTSSNRRIAEIRSESDSLLLTPMLPALTLELLDSFFLIVTSAYIMDISVKLYGVGWGSFVMGGWNLFDVLVALGNFFTTVISRSGSNNLALHQVQNLFLVGISLKLVQRVDNLMSLFEITMSGISALLSLLGLWIILLLFFGLASVEIFGLTKWGDNEDRNQNFSTLGSALVMLFLHEYGYVFSSALTGLVVESFSYVYERPDNANERIPREEIRDFKSIWAECANPQGYLERHRLVYFLSRLRGVFEVKIYPSEYSVNSLKLAGLPSENAAQFGSYLNSDINIRAVERVIDSIDRSVIKRRKALYSRLYHEAILSSRPGVGISFTEMLLLLAHHRLIEDNEALVPKDMAVRAEVNRVVTDLVLLDRVRSLFKMVSQRRRFLAHLWERHQPAVYDIPSIVVDAVEPSEVDSQASFAVDRSRLQRNRWNNRRRERNRATPSGGRGFWLKYRKSSSLPLPPGPPADSIIGRLRLIPPEAPEDRFTLLNRRIGDVIHLRDLNRDQIILNTAEPAVDLMEKRSLNYNVSMGWKPTLTFMGYGKPFQKHRRLIQQVFTKQKVAQYWPVQLCEARRLALHVLDYPGKHNDMTRKKAREFNKHIRKLHEYLFSEVKKAMAAGTAKPSFLSYQLERLHREDTETSEEVEDVKGAAAGHVLRWVGYLWSDSVHFER